jgi:hypothetical protein
MENIMNIRKICIVILALSLMLSGCSYEVGEVNEEYIIKFILNQDNGIVDNISVKSDNNITVALPESHTSIYINRLGYSMEDDKKAIFASDYNIETFKVVNADTNAVVYTDKISEDKVKIGDFSKVTEPGNYYIETDYIGRSYNFTISSDIYKDTFTKLLNSFYIKDEAVLEQPSDVIDACFGMDTVIYAMQCNGDVFEDESNIVEQLLFMSDDLISMQGSDGSIFEDYESTAAFCGIIAMCGNEFGKYEATIDKTYKESALNAWEWMEKNNCDTDSKNSARFYATAQLYNLLKTTDYKTMAEGYLRDKGDGYSQNLFDFFGAISYMNSKSEVDMSLCTDVMMDMITDADTICDNVSADKVYKVGASDIDEVMTDTLQICFFNYLVPSSEYIGVLSSAIDYIGGYNPDGINYMDVSMDGKYYEYKGIIVYAISNILSA